MVIALILLGFLLSVGITSLIIPPFAVSRDVCSGGVYACKAGATPQFGIVVTARA